MSQKMYRLIITSYSVSHWNQNRTVIYRNSEYIKIGITILIRGPSIHFIFLVKDEPYTILLSANFMYRNHRTFMGYSMYDRGKRLPQGPIISHSLEESLISFKEY